MSILKLLPACKNYLWGGTQLTDRCKTPAAGPLAESWELSCHPDGPSYIIGGLGAGQSLPHYLAQKGEKALGNNCRSLSNFPMLIKLIDAQRSLSVQVHPDDTYAFEHEAQPGKTEMWYILRCEEGAFIYVGFNREVSRTQAEQAIKEHRLEELLQKVFVKPGDAFLIEAGTVHAIGAGILLAEVQQSSNVTYRLYDYGRKDEQGALRPLHVCQGLDVAVLKPWVRKAPSRCHLVESPYFVVDSLQGTGRVGGETRQDSFTALLICEGSGVLYSDKQAFSFDGPDMFFIEAGSGAWQVEGHFSLLTAAVPPA